jgi:hypothetical protein
MGGRTRGGLEILFSLLRPEFLFIFVWAIKQMTLCLPNKWAGPNHRTNEKWAVVGRGGSSGARAYLQAVGAARATGGEESFEPGSLAALRLDGVRAREGGRQGGVFGSVFGGGVARGPGVHLDNRRVGDV